MNYVPLHKRDINTLRQASEDLHNQDKEYRRATNVDFLIYVALMLVIAFSVRAFIGEPIRVDGDSMFPTLYSGERMIVEKLSFYKAPPQRGDIIVCYYPGYTVSCVKRVIGLPGDVIAVEDGHIILNGEVLEESEYWRDFMYDIMPPHTVQENHVFVMGDNRNYSGDSRDPRIGDIPYEKIVGKAVCVMWPLHHVRGIHHVDYQ